jgi:hypothetical protein
MGREKASWPPLKTVPWPPDHAGPGGGAASDVAAQERRGTIHRFMAVGGIRIGNGEKSRAVNYSSVTAEAGTATEEVDSG